GPDNYILAKRLPVEGGVNRVLIRSTTRAGKISLKATSGNLGPAEVQLSSRAATTTNGLSGIFASDGLPSYLERGPTPLGESFKMLRRTLDVASVTAGSENEKAKNSLDDNELTDWISDGKADTAWIKYDLAQTEKIDQVVLKLTGWRTQSYPIQISVDDKVVYKGITTRSLGYVTLMFPATIGKTIKIELTGSASNRDAFGNIIEIGGTPDANSAAAKGGATKLGIVEAEFYQPVVNN
ncbi:MAG TPA: discoidin domain-containing protein, partial [Pyrinomonadaceae bacterium]|nr:discoidin domain-containing protein [Pyrinomonadaceae bacterium]